MTKIGACAFTLFICWGGISAQTTAPSPSPTPTPAPNEDTSTIISVYPYTRPTPKTDKTVVVAIAGDTVRKLAIRHRLDPEKVAPYNGLRPDSVLSSGREIKVPGEADLKYITVPVPRNAPAACRFAMTIPGEKNSGVNLFFQWQSYKREYNRVEVWSCTEPLNYESFRKRLKLPSTFKYILQHISVDCSGERITIGRMIAYKENGETINNRLLAFSGTYNEPVVPSSIGEDIMNLVCSR